MLDQIIAFVREILGLDNQVLNLSNMIVRTIIVYILAVILVRLGKKRFLAKPSSFDLVLMLIFGSVISRAVTGNVPFFPTIFAACVLIMLHTFFSYITFYSTEVGALIKGRPLVLIKEGKIQWDKMRKAQLTERDLLSALRRNAQVLNPSMVKVAILERNGEISVILNKHLSKVLEVKVEQGVQVIKIEIQD